MNRRIKSFLTFTGGAVTGLIFGGAGVIAAGLSSERIREGLKKEIAERIDDKLFSEKKQKVSYSNCSTKDDTMPYMRTVYSLRVDAEKLLDEMKKLPLHMALLVFWTITRLLASKMKAMRQPNMGGMNMIFAKEQ